MVIGESTVRNHQPDRQPDCSARWSGRYRSEAGAAGWTVELLLPGRCLSLDEGSAGVVEVRARESSSVRGLRFRPEEQADSLLACDYVALRDGTDRAFTSEKETA
jgi:hypothetical protein